MSLEKPSNETILSILNSSFAFYSKKLLVFFAIFLPLNLVNMFLIWAAFPFMPEITLKGFSNYPLLHLINRYASTAHISSFLLLAVWVITSLGNCIVIKYTLCALNGGLISITELVRAVLQNLGRIVAVSLIIGSLVITGFIIFIAPGVFMAVTFSLTLPAMLSENSGVFASLKRSRSLTHNVRWKIFTLLLIVSAILLVSIMLADYFLLLFHSTPYYDLLRMLSATLLSSLIEPIYPVSITQIYYSIKKPEAPIGEAQKRVPLEELKLEVKFCYNCGQFLPPEAIYCPNCGVKILRI